MSNYSKLPAINLNTPLHDDPSVSVLLSGEQKTVGNMQRSPDSDDTNMELVHFRHDVLPETVLIHRCAIKKMQVLIDQFRAYGDPTFSRRDKGGKLVYHSGGCATIIKKNGPFVKTYSKDTAEGKSLFGLILNHRNMVTLLASSQNLATHGEYFSSQVTVAGEHSFYSGDRKFFRSRTLTNYDPSKKALFHDTEKVMEKYLEHVKATTSGITKISPHEKPKLKRGGKIIEHNELLVAKKNNEERSCIGVFADLISHDDMKKNPLSNLFQKELLAHFPHVKQTKKKDIFQRCYEKNMAELKMNRVEFNDLKKICRDNRLNFYVRNLGVDGKPHVQEINIESVNDFDEFLLLCSGKLSSPKQDIFAVPTGEQEKKFSKENSADLPTQSNDITFSSKHFPIPSREWNANLAKMISQHFNKPYKYTTHKILAGLTKKIGSLIRNDMVEREINGTKYKVFRRKHSLAHGVRQGFLALDIVDFCMAMQRNPSKNKEVISLVNWIDEKHMHDPNFVKKLEFAASFQRTGRESEANSYSKSYNEYERRDAANFLEMASADGNPFDSDEERTLYAESILFSTAHEGKIDQNMNTDLSNLRDIIHAAHLLDLRRITHFDGDRIKAKTAEELFGEDIITEEPWAIVDKNVKNLIDFLWSRTGEYLEATGDTDLVKQKNQVYKNRADAYKDEFFILNNDPVQLVDALHHARETSKLDLAKI